MSKIRVLPLRFLNQVGELIREELSGHPQAGGGGGGVESEAIVGSTGSCDLEDQCNWIILKW